MANEEANENVEYNLPNFQLEWKKLLRPAGIGAATADNLTKSQFHWLNFLKSSAWLALAGISVFFATVTHAQTVSTSYVTTNGSCLRVREDANLHSRILDCIPNRTQIRTTEIINGFARLSPNRFVSARWIGSTPNNRPVRTITRRGVGGPVYLSLGSRSSAVTEVQRALGVQPTGYYGPTTTRVVREFQARNNLRVDGIVGPETRNAIFRNGYQNGYQNGTGGPIILGLGSRGSAVTEIQRALGVEPTGYYGPTTTRVVREFQARNYLRVDGIVGPETRSAILRN
ncbi:peptidoglycan-binding domain-containing protein [Nodularia spumigena]|nr:peptidoglycan-binding protein [Nodularia spumigena]MDB9333533.1 peptidoglycan-binding protein [Nodularia spumigena CS-590/01]MDB9356954.1 peptidoglycan-binding protein [Nodularia spumigena CS-587/03]MDB9401305.1 peptidoglycan-binding protein [Microcystis aeruginosa CS-567/02-A1]MDB9303458.1 peptidoglycan-binding protein [Nodularia spumigena CS-591/12]MDB9318302.1 peptidoglycan-binding protein [Nodularia spumigena CS-590/01A]